MRKTHIILLTAIVISSMTIGVAHAEWLGFEPTVNFSAGNGPSSVYSEDFDGDGDYDLTVANIESGNVSILLNNGDGTFATAVNYGAGDYPASVLSEDLDGDGDYDLAVANNNSDNVSILLNNGDGTFATAVDYGAGNGPESIFSEDLDGDGDHDLTVANRWSNNVSVLLNNGDGTFAAAVNYDAGDGAYSVISEDLDGDGDYDLTVANYYSYNVSILLNNGDGTFAGAVNYGAGDSPWSVYSEDLDGDGDYDLAVANGSSDNVSILLNNGDGTFATAVNYGAGNLPISVYSEDFDIDGDYDLTVANGFSDNVSILLNNGDGTFSTAVNYSAGDYPTSVFSEDLDGDGDYDLAVANGISDNVSILINRAISYELTSSIQILSPYVPAVNGDIWFNLNIENTGDDSLTNGLFAELYPIIGDCAGGTQFDFNLQKQLTTDPFAPGETFTGYYYYHVDNVGGSFNQAAIEVAVGTAYEQWLASDCGEFIFLREWGRSNHEPAFYGSEWLERDDDMKNNIPSETLLHSNYPNPFNATTAISFDLVNPGNIKLEVYNLMGQKVESLIDGNMQAGQHSISWDASSYSSGIYFYKLSVGDKVFTKRMTLLK
ncbi:MAG: T9SS type A sorting domain-containing protein [candidate division Zixibacteria bacterium]|nr:T9SS type A sorting domain-containing protein [candidate division Zixibacteria bacterium]